MADYGFDDQATIADLQRAMARGELTAVDLVRGYAARIEALDRDGPRLHAVLEVNPDAEAIAAALDEERRRGHVRGLLHGIPILLKDNIDTGDRTMTTAGSLALVGAPAPSDAEVVRRLRAAGAVILGKTNLSEWANFRSTHSSSGWCGVNGQSRNPYVLDRNPCGSSSGSAIAVAAGLCAAALGTETDGSIVCPANACGVVGIKPTVGLTSRVGLIPIAHTQDTVGPLARSVADAAAVLAAIRDGDPGGAAVRPDDGTDHLDPHALRGARIGVARNLGFGTNPKVDAIMAEVLAALADAGAVVVDPAEVPSDLHAASEAELEVLLYEFKADLNAYLARRSDVALCREGLDMSLAGLIAFNEAHRDEELRYFGQERFEGAQERGPLSEPAYRGALELSRRLSGEEGLDAVLVGLKLDALVAPTGGPAWPIDLVSGDCGRTGSAGPAARAGYPLVSVPAGYVSGLPVNVTFMGRAHSERTLIRLAHAYEQATRVRRPPRYLPSL